jgi:1-deoxy-D-xylulose-5-phosphate reductoisomerase
VAPLDLPAIGALHFQAPDSQRFPALPLAYRALEAGGTAPAVLNAANEEAVYAFLEGRLDFLGIVRALEAVLGETTVHPATNLEAIWAADTEARQRVRERTPARPDPS